MIPAYIRLAVAGALVLTLSAPLGPSAADAPWQTHQDQMCGIELKYPPSYSLEASGAPDACAPWITIGVREARGLRALFSLEIREMEAADRAEAATTRTPPSARDFALHVATTQCTADGPDGSTYCTNAEVRSTFRTAQGFRGFEIHLTEVHESFAPKKIATRPRGPILALDLSDGEVVRVLMAGGAPARLGELKAILARPELRDVPTEPGVVHAYHLDYVSTATTPLTLGGRFHGDRLLAYAHPTSPDTRLRAGVTSFPLVIFYGAPIKPVTFNALLNGDNITGRFTPEPGGSQVVRIPLGPGLNTLVLSVEGSTASGQRATDTHRLVFRVE